MTGKCKWIDIKWGLRVKYKFIGESVETPYLHIAHVKGTSTQDEEFTDEYSTEFKKNLKNLRKQPLV